MLKCKICNTEFPPVKERHYVCRENAVTGLSTINRKEEEKDYDCFDCPNCGCQVIARERYRKVNA